jgi:hypothetical protein
MIGSMTPKPPVTWIVSFELTEVERQAWKFFLYRLKDGVVATGIEGHDLEVLRNTFSPLHHLFDEGYVE